MRTSRVGHPTSSLYRNSKRFVHADEAFAQTFENGVDSRRQDPREQFNQQKKKKKPAAKAKKLVTSKAHVIVKGMQFDADSTMTRNQLIRQSIKLNTLNKYRRRIGTYRTSI